MSEWWSIEVLDGTSSASLWAESHTDSIITAALEHGLLDWERHDHTWGVVLEFSFRDEAAWDAFRSSIAVQSALDLAPNPTSGVIVYRGRGGSSGRREPRRPLPIAGAGAVALPLPVELDDLDDDPYRRRALITV